MVNKAWWVVGGLVGVVWLATRAKGAQAAGVVPLNIPAAPPNPAAAVEQAAANVKAATGGAGAVTVTTIPAALPTLQISIPSVTVPASLASNPQVIQAVLSAQQSISVAQGVINTYGDIPTAALPNAAASQTNLLLTMKDAAVAQGDVASATTYQQQANQIQQQIQMSYAAAVEAVAAFRAAGATATSAQTEAAHAAIAMYGPSVYY